jgi:hypothetical protein
MSYIIGVYCSIFLLKSQVISLLHRPSQCLLLVNIALRNAQFALLPSADQCCNVINNLVNANLLLFFIDNIDISTFCELMLVQQNYQHHHHPLPRSC